MTCVRRNLNNRACCNSWQKGIRTINNQYPDDNREFEIAAGNGISVVPITAGILITNTSAASSFVEGRNINIVPSGGDLEISVTDEPEFDGLTINGTSTFNGDIIQNGAAYETHAEKVYTTNDYIIMRDGAVAGLGTGDYSGFQVKLYDGVNDGRLVIDNSGTARVGDVGDEEPLLTRDEAADLTDGDSLIWDAANYKAITTAIPSAIDTALSGKGIINSVQSANGTTSVSSGTLIGLNGTITVPETGTYLIVGTWDIHTNPNTAQTYSMHVRIDGTAYNLYMGHYSTDSYARGTLSYVANIAANQLVELALYQNLGSAVTVLSDLKVVRLI